jgi:hypothetical protein
MKTNEVEGYVAHVGGGDVYTGVWGGNLMERNNLEDLGLDGGIEMGLPRIGWGHVLD